MMKNKVLSLYDWFLIAGVIVSNVLYSVLSGDMDVVGSVASIAGVLCVVLVAKGNIWNYLFGIINVSMYAYISYKASLYGDAGLNAFYYVPMQFIGWWQWRKRGSTCCRNGDHVGVLSAELSERFQSMAKAQSGVKFLFSDFFYLICKVLAQIRVLEKSKY